MAFLGASPSILAELKRQPLAALLSSSALGVVEDVLSGLPPARMGAFQFWAVELWFTAHGITSHEERQRVLEAALIEDARKGKH